MRAFVITELGTPVIGEVREVDEPQGSHEWANGRRLLIDVHATGVSFPDVLQSRGKYQHGVSVPYISGGEVAGTVLEAPTDSRLRPGDRVAALTLWGGMAERALALEQYTVRLPDSMSFIEGAALQLNYSTAWFALYRVGLRAGETVAIHGGAGGVGTATIQVARALGATVIALVSTAEKERTARDAGAEYVVRTEPGWVEELKDLTDGRGVSVVVDPVGGERFTDSLRALDVGGRVAVVGFAAGTIPTVKVNRLLLRDLSVVGVALAPYVDRHPEITEVMSRELEQLAESGRISPHIGCVLGLADGGEAIGVIDRREALGKVVVQIRR